MLYRNKMFIVEVGRMPYGARCFIVIVYTEGNYNLRVMLFAVYTL